MSSPAVCVVGLGRVGLPTAAVLARSMHVVGTDHDRAVLDRIRRLDLPEEPGLGTIVAAALSAGGLTLAATPVVAPTYIVCVPTPLGPEALADLSALDAAIGAVLEVAPDDVLIVVESTVPVGTTAEVAARVRQVCPGARVAYCPERVLPGAALAEIVGNDRIVGGVDPTSTDAAEALWATVVGGTIRTTDATTAELAKLVENAARDVELALANTVARVARGHGVDPWVLRDLVNGHPRVSLLEPGIGVGGHCLPVDPWFMIGADPAATALLRTARDINDGVPERCAEAVRRAAGGRAPVAVLGLGYKANVADPRGSPAIALARSLATSHEVVVTDPWIRAPAGLVGVSLPEALACPVVVLAVAHGVYRSIEVGPDQLAIDLCGGWRFPA